MTEDLAAFVLYLGGAYGFILLVQDAVRAILRLWWAYRGEAGPR